MDLLTPLDIKIELLKKGVSMRKIAKHEQVSQEAISACVRGKLKSHRLRNAVASAIGKKVDEIWDTAPHRKQ